MKYTKDEPSLGVDKCFGGGGQTISDAPEMKRAGSLVDHRLM